MKDVNVTEMIQTIKNDLENALEKKLFKKITAESSIKFYNEYGDFEYDGQFLYFVPSKPIKKLRIEIKLKNNL
jgi:hypothetical protein